MANKEENLNGNSTTKDIYDISPNRLDTCRLH